MIHMANLNNTVFSLTTQRSALSYNMARSVQVASDRMIRERQYVDLNDHCMGKMAVLYPIEKAYEAFMEYVDLLNEKGMMRFEHKRYCNRMKPIFDAYQRNRDRLSNIDPVDFSDMYDIMDNVHGRLIKTYQWQESQGLLNSGATGTIERMGVLLFTLYTMTRISEHLVNVVRRNVEARHAKRFDIMNYIDFEAIIKHTREHLITLFKREHIVLSLDNVKNAEQAISNIRSSLACWDKYKDVQQLYEERHVNKA